MAATPPARFMHRDLSWLAFNERVLEEAEDAANPLLERVNFLAIFASNLDEFFMVRMAALKRLLDAGYQNQDDFGWYPQNLYDQLQERVQALTKRHYDGYEKRVRKELEKHRVAIRRAGELSPEQKRFVKRYFDSTLFPIVTPMAVDQGHPFPALASRTLAFAVVITRYNQPHLAIVPVPRVVPRLLKLPAEKDEHHFILVDEIMRQHLGNFFRGYKIEGQALFRIVRDSELGADEEYAASLLKAIETELKKRPKAKVVRFEIETAVSDEHLALLAQGIDFPPGEIVRREGDLDLSCLFELSGQVPEPGLRFPTLTPPKPDYPNIFDHIKEAGFLLHVPYQSFQPTVDLVQQAARDKNVLAIKMTLYRTNDDSAIVAALQEAARAKKQVTVLVEIKARFDEEKNIQWVKELEDAGCHVIYGIPKLKIHSKITLVVRREEDRIHRYVHLSTGNYNEKTARIYTDLGFFTAQDDFGQDISDVFNVISGYSVPSRWQRVVSAPNDLRKYFCELVDREIACQELHKNGLVFAKMNSLEDPQLIEKLYQASQRGVQVRLVVRGICCLRPGVPGLSETIEVRSLVGRFLEHSRIFLFHNNGDRRVFLASADWMRRNFDRRIELLFEITKEEMKEHLQFVLDTCWRDTVKARVMQSDGTYTRAKGDEKFNAQEFLIENYAR
ncbi:MAG: polyphosphate kinase 1 [Verrucomicrobia bacterium]|nr:polyphosphate kinase 1 [Verrucomicrobiota bacterium]